MKHEITLGEAIRLLELDKEEIAEFLMKYDFSVESDDDPIPAKLYEELEAYAKGNSRIFQKFDQVPNQQQKVPDF